MFGIKNPYFRTFLYSIITSLALMLLLIPLFIFNLYDIPLGIFIGMLINSLSYLFIYLFEEKEALTHSIKISAIIGIIRFVVLGIFIFLSILLKQTYQIITANPFAITGGYFVTLIIYLINLLIKRKEK